MPGKSTKPLFVLTCSQAQQNKEIRSAANQFCDPHRSLSLDNYCSYSTLITKLLLSHTPRWGLKGCHSLAPVGNKESCSFLLTPPHNPGGRGGESEGKGKTHGLG